MYLFLRKPLTLNTTGVIIQKPIKVVTLTSYRSHIQDVLKKNEISKTDMLAICWCYSFSFLTPCYKSRRHTPT